MISRFVVLHSFANNTDNILIVIWQSLNMACSDHYMFWAACTLGYFGFLRWAEFTVLSLANLTASLHLTVQDIAADDVSAPYCMRVRIKASKTDPFPKGAEIHIDPEVYPLCAVQAMMAYLVQRGNVPGPLFLLQDGHPLSRPRLTDWLRQKVCRWDPRQLFKPQFSHRCSSSGCPWLSPRPPNSGLGAVVQQCLSFVYSHTFRSFGFSVTEAH